MAYQSGMVEEAFVKINGHVGKSHEWCTQEEGQEIYGIGNASVPIFSYFAISSTVTIQG